ncbi:hypothetical protein ACFQ0M_47715 [Kitasatospora aburaviensis]|uniref:Uncharacterized protein n=1 Tax=Kitasatospora aburaviensis TaxID=67265 RepID=A0ABW1EYM3_9ACTN
MNRVCVFCGTEVAKKGKGEHVYPEWWHRMWLESGGPFYAMVGDQYIRNRNGERRSQETLQPLKLDVCGSWPGSPNCNGRLEQLFENRGKPAVEAVWRRQAVLGREETFAFAAWWAKTLLLVDHPQTRHTFPGLEEVGKSRTYTADPGTSDPLLPLLNGPSLLPSALSLWLAVGDEVSGEHALVGHSPLMLPRIGFGDLPEAQGHVMGTGPSLLCGRKRVLLQLVHHPYAEVAHPFDRAGLAVRLWPDPPAQLDISAVPVLSNTGISQFESQFVCGGGSTYRSVEQGPLLVHACSGQPHPWAWPLCGCLA